MGFECSDSIFFYQRLESPFAQSTGTDLCFNIFLNHGEPNVGKNEIPHIFTKLTLFIELHSRNTNGFLPNFRGIGIVTALHRTANICLMSFCRSPTNQSVIVENGFENCYIIILVAHGKNIIMDYNITGENVFAILVNNHTANGSERK